MGKHLATWRLHSPLRGNPQTVQRTLRLPMSRKNQKPVTFLRNAFGSAEKGETQIRENGNRSESARCNDPSGENADAK